MSEIFVNQTLRLEVTISDQDENIVDISSATTKTFTFVKPDKSSFVKTAILVNDGIDGKMEYTTGNVDLDINGAWSMQGLVIIAGAEYPATISKFTVANRLG